MIEPANLQARGFLRQQAGRRKQRRERHEETSPINRGSHGVAYVTKTNDSEVVSQTFCGYHNAVGTKTFYAVMPYPGCAGCTGGLSVFDALTSTSSHELCEAITDPIPGQGWYDDTNGEIGDICAWQTKKVGAYTVQLEWSNQANQCL